uniref:tetratricopeptide repeat protein n=1 Tax=Halomonas sp. TaxID=1486246 RepID=UPI00260B5000|nr:tetratricopeptide repeat protein [Halomonas sp.]
MPSNTRIRQLTGPLTSLTLAALLCGCQGLSISSADAQPKDPMVNAPPITRGLDAEGLSLLLTAEMAGQRGDFRRATEGYLKAAERYHSPALVKRATFAARFTDDPELLERAARRWQSLAPETTAAAELLGSLASIRGDWTEALQQKIIASDTRERSDITRFVDTALASGADPSAMDSILREALVTPPASEPVRLDLELALSLTEAAQGQLKNAQQRLARLGKTADDMPQRWLATSRLNLEQGNPQAARQAAKRGLDLAPQDALFLLLMAQADIRMGNLAAAEKSTDALLAERGDSPELRVGLARLYISEGHTAPVKHLLLPLVGNPDAPSATYLLLASIAEEEGDIDNALLYYRQVPEGPNYLLSRQAASLMLTADGRLQDARDFLRSERQHHDESYTGLVIIEAQLLDDEGLGEDADTLLERELARTPEDSDLRYFYAMRAWQNGDQDTSERELRRLVEQQPDNATALNALGYTLADSGSPDELDEAEALIQRAYKLDPQNAAIQDSLGWVAYRRGDLSNALRWIEQAWNTLPDQEVAAHLIEVLWDLGQHERAQEILGAAREQFLNHPYIDELLERRPEIIP